VKGALMQWKLKGALALLMLALTYASITCLLAPSSGTLHADSSKEKKDLAGLPPKGLKHGLGFVKPKGLPAIHEACKKRNGSIIAKLPKVMLAKFDCREKGWVPPIVDQGQCGSCWDFAGAGVCTMAFIRAGLHPADGSFRLSEQYVLDCLRSGGCEGDDYSTVFDACHGTGLPNTLAYGPYTSDDRQACKFKVGTSLSRS